MSRYNSNIDEQSMRMVAAQEKKEEVNLLHRNIRFLDSEIERVKREAEEAVDSLRRQQRELDRKVKNIIENGEYYVWAATIEPRDSKSSYYVGYFRTEHDLHSWIVDNVRGPRTTIMETVPVANLPFDVVDTVNTWPSRPYPR